MRLGQKVPNLFFANLKYLVVNNFWPYKSEVTKLFFCERILLISLLMERESKISEVLMKKKRFYKNGNIKRMGIYENEA